MNESKLKERADNVNKRFPTLGEALSTAEYEVLDTRIKIKSFDNWHWEAHHYDVIAILRSIVRNELVATINTEEPEEGNLITTVGWVDVYFQRFGRDEVNLYSTEQRIYGFKNTLTGQEVISPYHKVTVLPRIDDKICVHWSGPWAKPRYIEEIIDLTGVDTQNDRI